MPLEDSSSLKVPYDLRPAKQAERRMFLDLLSTLGNLGFPIRKYHYVGFGSIFFHDHRLFHRELGISRMTSVEGFPPLYKRCRFNQPFSHVKLFQGLSSDYVPTIEPDDQYVVWFDYDFSLNRIVCEDLLGAASLLCPGSILIVTIDTHLPDEIANLSLRKLFRYFREEIPNYAHGGLAVSDFAGDNRLMTFLKVVMRCITRGLSTRDGITFEPLINMTYADGHKMLTVGGMVADENARASLKSIPLEQLPFIRRKIPGKPFHIPRFVFTKRELLSMEASCPGGQLDLKTGVKKSEFKKFLPFYRYWPTYSEIL